MYRSDSRRVSINIEQHTKPDSGWASIMNKASGGGGVVDLSKNELEINQFEETG